VSSEARLVGNIKYVCYSGAMRVYMPHPNPDEESDGIRHRRLLFSFLQELGANQVIDILYKAFSQDFYYHEAKQLIRIEDCVILNKEASNVSHIIELIEDFSKKRASTNKDFDEFVEEENKRRIQLESEVNALELELEAAKEEADTYKSNLFYKEELLNFYMLKSKAVAALEQGLQYVRSLRNYPITCQDVVQYFIKVFGDRIAFTDSGFSSLETCRKRLDYLWEALFHMATTLYELHIASV
jgi:hypothetical protein